MTGSFVSVYVFLLPAVGYIWFHKKHSLERHIKPMSGIELTYSSAAAGAIFFSASFLILRLTNFLALYYGNVKLHGLRSRLLNEIPHHGIIYFSAAFAMSFIVSRFFLKVKKDSIFLGESKLSEIWYDLSNRQAELVIFLKNQKSYIGFLREAEVSERLPISERVISISVVRSGSRKEDGTIDWNTTYAAPITHHFNMSEIVNFSEYSSKAKFNIGSRKQKGKR